ncbi:17076_t:CDS:1 [Funneliformis geosporum]|nr:17076_t:CDS:1 [Funneliformis geosporum]
MYKDKNKTKEYARLTMAIRRAKEKGLDISELLIKRKALKVMTDKVITKKDITRKYNSARKIKDNKQPRIMVGTSDFKKLRLNNAIIVDKSLLIKAVLEAPSEVPLIARPRR